MGRPQETPADLVRHSAMLVSLAVLIQISAFAQSDPLKLVITVEQQTISAPFPVRVTLHLHNSGKETLWLYRRAAPASRSPGISEEPSTPFGTSVRSSGGSTLAIRVAAADNSAAYSGAGEALEDAGLPHPRLIRLSAGDDYEEKAAVRLSPAMAETNGEKRAVWGRYKFTVAYAAKYSKAEELERILGVALWQGEIESNSVELELQPSPVEAHGSIAGAVVGGDNVPRRDVLVSISDHEERLVNQASTDNDGRFSFTHLPFGLYWVTIRYTNITEDTAVFRHVVLTPSEPAGTIDFLLTVPETYQPKQILHKPVLLRVTDGAGAPLASVALEITWSSGSVLESVKARTADDGSAAVELIPGRNYITVKRKGCAKEELRQDVAPGVGIDGFKIVSECSKK